MLDMHMHRMHHEFMKLKTYLRTKKLTDEAFGALVGLSQSQVSRIKRGKSIPSWPTIAAIEEATKGKVKLSDFRPEQDTGSADATQGSAA